MDDREAEIGRVVAGLREREVIEDAFVAKSFTDRLVVVDVRGDGPLPDAVYESLRAHDLYGANEVYGHDDGTRTFAGDVGGSTRHQFVDVRTRGEHQSYVVD